jgi:hypothetical protein
MKGMDENFGQEGSDRYLHPSPSSNCRHGLNYSMVQDII